MATLLRLKATNGQYLCAEAGGGREVVANRTAPGPWETFTVEAIAPADGPLIGGQRIALRTASGHYLCAEGGGGGTLIANRTTVGPWETFTIAHADLSAGAITSGQAVIVRTENGHFLCAELGGGQGVTADRTSFGAWEIFGVEVEAPPFEPSHPAESPAQGEPTPGTTPAPPA